MTQETSLVLNLINEYNLKSLLDIGAHIGEYSYTIKTAKPEIEVFMIEANDLCDPYLKNTKMPYLIKCLGNSEKEVKLFIDKNNPMSSGTSYKLELTEHFSKDNFSIIKTETLDSVLFKNYGFQKQFDFIKLDTQGSEKEILEGGINTAKKAKFIQLEISLIQYNENSPLKDEMVEYMKSIGFNIFLYLDTQYLGKIPLQENIIFKKEIL